MFAIEYPNAGLYTGGKARFTRRNPETGEVTYARLATPAEELIGLQIAAMNALTAALREQGKPTDALHAALTQSQNVLAKQEHACERGEPCECGNGLTGGQCFDPPRLSDVDVSGG